MLVQPYKYNVPKSAPTPVALWDLEQVNGKMAVGVSQKGVDVDQIVESASNPTHDDKVCALNIEEQRKKIRTSAQGVDVPRDERAEKQRLKVPSSAHLYT